MADRVGGPEIERLIQLLARLPGLGPRSARARGAAPHPPARGTARPLSPTPWRGARDTIVTCSRCGNVDTIEPCSVCRDPRRDPAVLVVVETVSDLWALERAAALRARYHVLGGTLSPLDGVGPDDLNLATLAGRVAEDGVTEVILAVNATVDGQTTAHYVTDLIAHLGGAHDPTGPWRARRRRARLSRRGHAVGGAAEPDGVLNRIPHAHVGVRATWLGHGWAARPLRRGCGVAERRFQTLREGRPPT